ncbi:MAG TPA: hypothetical protein PKM50_05550 [Methanoregula sp.]|nr:hypothetical protein [Methanoregula sp.]
MQSKKFFSIFISCIVIVMIGIAGCVSSSASSSSTPISTQTLNMCIKDPGNADIWESSPVNLWDQPGGLSAGAKISGKLPACDNINVEVWDEKTIGGVVFWKISYGSTQGWITKRMIEGE